MHPVANLKTRLFLDWAYLEDWCRRLTGSFADVYVFTIPLYLPRLEVDGKWRVVRLFPFLIPPRYAQLHNSRFTK
jgi:DNA/RNA non-specific endonuclease.